MDSQEAINATGTIDTVKKNEIWQITVDQPCTEDNNNRSALVIGRLPVCGGMPSYYLGGLVVPRNAVPKNVVVGLD